MAPINREKLGNYVLDKLKSSVGGERGEKVYADLSGVVLDEAGYRQKLDHDQEFAEAEVDRALRIPPPASAVKGISPAEQRTIAKFVHVFAKKNPDIPKDDLFNKFFAHNQTLGEYSADDLKKVASTLRFEYHMDVPVSDASNESEAGNESEESSA